MMTNPEQTTQSIQDLTALLTSSRDKDQITLLLRMLLDTIETSGETENRKTIAKSAVVELAKSRMNMANPHAGFSAAEVAKASTYDRPSVQRIPGDTGGALNSRQIATYSTGQIPRSQMNKSGATDAPNRPMSSSEVAGLTTPRMKAESGKVTKFEDAASIVGERLAAELDRRYRQLANKGKADLREKSEAKSTHGLTAAQAAAGTVLVPVLTKSGAMDHKPANPDNVREVRNLVAQRQADPDFQKRQVEMLEEAASRVARKRARR